MKLKDIAKQINVNPRTARRRLRDAKIAKPGTRWEFPKRQRRQIQRVIRGR